MARRRWRTPEEEYDAELARLLDAGLERAQVWLELHTAQALGYDRLAAASWAYRATLEHDSWRGERWSATYQARYAERMAARAHAQAVAAAVAVAQLEEVAVA